MLKKFRVFYADGRSFCIEVHAEDEEEAKDVADSFVSKNPNEWHYCDEQYDVREIEETKK